MFLIPFKCLNIFGGNKSNQKTEAIKDPSAYSVKTFSHTWL